MAEPNTTTTTTDPVTYQPISPLAQERFPEVRLAVEQFATKPITHNVHVINIIFDGTNNNKEAVPNGYNMTNPASLHEQLLSEGQDAIYARGIGSPLSEGESGNLLDQGVAAADALRQLNEGWDAYIQKAQQLLAENPEVEIQVNVIGFSRGSAVAREFMNRVDDWGIPSSVMENRWTDADGREMVSYAPRYDGLSRAGGSVHQTALLYDTVVGSGMSTTNTSTAPSEYDSAKGPVFRMGIPASVDSLLHLVAANEERDLTFGVTSVLPSAGYQDPRLLEVTLPGVHSDIGGSYKSGPGNYKWPSQKWRQ